MLTHCVNYRDYDDKHSNYVMFTNCIITNDLSIKTIIHSRQGVTVMRDEMQKLINIIKPHLVQQSNLIDNKKKLEKSIEVGQTSIMSCLKAYDINKIHHLNSIRFLKPSNMSQDSLDEICKIYDRIKPVLDEIELLQTDIDALKKAIKKPHDELVRLMRSVGFTIVDDIELKFFPKHYLIYRKPKDMKAIVDDMRDWGG